MNKNCFDPFVIYTASITHLQTITSRDHRKGRIKTERVPSLSQHIKVVKNPVIIYYQAAEHHSYLMKLVGETWPAASSLQAVTLYPTV